MRLHMLLIAATCSCGRVKGVDQDAKAVVLDARTPHAGSAAGTAFHDQIFIGTIEKSEDHRVPVLVEWTVAKDAAGCARVQTVKLTRTGGPTSTEVYQAGINPVQDTCGSRSVSTPGGPPVDMFDQINVHYCWRWNGAANKEDCAYSGGFMVSADLEKVEGIIDRP